MAVAEGSAAPRGSSPESIAAKSHSFGLLKLQDETQKPTLIVTALSDTIGFPSTVWPKGQVCRGDRHGQRRSCGLSTSVGEEDHMSDASKSLSLAIPALIDSAQHVLDAAKDGLAIVKLFGTTGGPENYNRLVWAAGEAKRLIDTAAGIVSAVESLLNTIHPQSLNAQERDEYGPF